MKNSKTFSSSSSTFYNYDSEELKRPENKGLEKAIELLRGVKEDIDTDAKGGPLGWADLIHFGGILLFTHSIFNSFFI